ncbi:tudor domain-containing protein 15 [Hyperolius riggenbachi]|uniref:tudor domain-containing protein 15 n=1 Tax=Hyperolius riggenbachi TaxID=752182 RepID=UPI0035A2D21D
MDYMSLCQKPDLRIDLIILKISCFPQEVLVKFQGRYISDCEFDYHVLQNEIQRVPKVHDDLDIGQFCLVQDKPLGVWHRGKLLDKVSQIFEVVLIDQGNTLKVTSQQIASASGELFVLPPKVVNGIFSNLLPLDEKWSPRAINYFSSLIGDQVNGLVKTFLPHQVILLEVPKVISHAIELNLAKYMDADSFCLLVEIIHKFPANSHGKQMPDLLQQRKLSADLPPNFIDNSHPHFQKVLDHLRPEISLGAVEKIKISAAVSPDNFYCHILSWEVELNKLMESMSLCYESPKIKANSSVGSYSVLCAAKRKDGLWYRGIIQALISCSHVKIWFIDIGSSETVLSEDVHNLQPEFLSLPMMAIPCALSRSNDHVENARNRQLLLFKEALMGHIVIAQMDQFCSEEHVFSILLYEKEYELNTNCHLTNQPIPMFPPIAYSDNVTPECEEKNEEPALPVDSKPNEVNRDEIISYKSLQMELDSVHVAYVEYVLNPSNFWIRTDVCNNEYCTMMDEIAEKYNKCEVMEMLVEDPQPGKLCCALYTKDGHYYRAVITEVLNLEISVYFIDFGNTETIPFYNVKVLLPQFSTLPALAMCCTLAYTFPLEDIWVRSANDYFKSIVSGNALLCHVLAKQNDKYVLEMRLSENSEGSDIASLLVEAGYAELWKIDVNRNSLNPEIPLQADSKKSKSKLGKPKNSGHGDAIVSLQDLTMQRKAEKQPSTFYEPSDIPSSNASPICYKQYAFKPGTVIFVKCSNMESPGMFWCQLSFNLHSLDTLMDEIQVFYKSCKSKYKHGQVACIAKSSCTGKYYRAALVGQICENKVDVLFVDYGIVENVLLSGLREIHPQFLQWEGQAFRCCLSKVFYSTDPQRRWSANECHDLKGFLHSATDPLKCTVIALFATVADVLCITVDLEAYNNASNCCLSSEGYHLSQDFISSVRLLTFCYSTFDVHVGSREDIYVTFVYNTGKFYCQLAKNEETFDMLMKKVSELGEKLKPEIGTKTKQLCIVKYIQDGQFYRALACPVDLAISSAFFIDFGDSQMVKQTEMLPIPNGAIDILFEPMQAIPCYLSGLKEVEWTSEAKDWFEEHCVGQLLSASVVSRDSIGQLELDLCCGNVSINHKIREILGADLLQKKPNDVPSLSNNITERQANEKCSSLQDLQETSKTYSKLEKSYEVKNDTISDFNVTYDLKTTVIPEDALLLSSSSPNSPCKSLHTKTLLNSTNPVQSESIAVFVNSYNLPSSKQHLMSSDLPQLVLETSSSHLAYSSHINSPSEFYVQLAENEEQIMQLAEELNDMPFQPIDVKYLEKGVLVVAQFPDDNAFYRAEIKELKGNYFHVEFIDYGNAAIVDPTCVFKLPEKYSCVPRLSIPVFLTGLHKRQGCHWSKNLVDGFTEKVNNECFSCTFIGRRDFQWEVSIVSKGQSVSDFLQSFETTLELASVDTMDNFVKSDIPLKPSQTEKIKHVDVDTIDNFVKLDIALKPSQIEKIKNVYLASCGKLFVTLAKSSAAESKITELISDTVKQVNNCLSAKDIKEGMVCLVKSEKRQTWLRASVEKVFLRTMEMSVFFVDYGAHEMISMHNAKALTPTAQSIPYQAVACKWTWTEKIGESLLRKQLQSLLHNEVQVLFLKFLELENVWKVEILVDGVMLMEHFNTVFHQAELKTNNAETFFHFESETLPTIQRPSFKCLELVAGFVTTFHSPSTFNIQVQNSLDTMNVLSQYIENLADDLFPLEIDSLRVGSVCLVKSFKENEWCRAEIVSINMISISLNLLDYGVYKLIPFSDYSKLKAISKELACLPALTASCKLHGVNPKDGHYWSENTHKYCINFVQDSALLVLPLETTDMNITEVSIYGKGNLEEKLVSKGFATKSNWNRSFTNVAEGTPVSTVPTLSGK